ncbi:MAG: hypothetical protein JWR38_4308 [Mucilaginibacter sp.]|nr:hypothetical protein [Mucilaginibacter sp.]
MKFTYSGIIAVCCILLLAFSALGQKKPEKLPDDIKEPCRTFFIDFDQDGKMVGFPHAVIRKKDIVVFRVRTETNYYKVQLTAMKDKLKKLAEFMALNPEISAYLFCDSHARDAFAKELTDNIKKIDAIPFAIDTQQFSKALPLALYRNKIFNGQFEMGIRNGNKDIVTLPMNAKALSKKNCYYFYSDPKKIGDLIGDGCTSCQADSLNFNLIYHDPMNATVIDWYKGLYKDSYLNAQVGRKLIIAIRAFKASQTCDNASTVLGDVSGYASWIKPWLWLTGGALTLNPVGLLTKPQSMKIDARVTEISRNIDSLQQTGSFIDSTKKYLIPEYQRGRRVLPTIIHAGNVNKSRIDALSKEKEGLQKIVAADKKLRLTTKVYYSGVLFFKNDHLIVQKQYDAANKYRPVPTGARTTYRLRELPENEQVNVMVNNATVSINYKFAVTDAAFNDLEEFTKLTVDALSNTGLTSVLDPAMAATYNKLTAFLASVKDEQKNITSLRVASGETPPIADCGFVCADLPKFIPFILGYYDANAAFFRGTSTDITALVPGQVGAVADTTFKYHTVAYDITHASESDAPYTRNFTIQTYQKDPTKTTDIQKGFVNIGKLRFFQLAAGVAVNRSPVTVSTVDTTKKGFKINSADNSSTVILGFKFYPFRSYQRDRSILPRYIEKRVHFSASLSVLHPLDNFYFGGGYDIVPGLAIDLGWNYYKYTAYTISNNTITNTAVNYQWSDKNYISVTLNPVLFTQLVKTFFK